MFVTLTINKQINNNNNNNYIIAINKTIKKN